MSPMNSRRVKTATVVVAAAGMFVAGCSSSSKSSSSSSTSAAPATTAAAAAPATSAAAAAPSSAAAAPSSAAAAPASSPAASGSAGNGQVVASQASTSCTSTQYGAPKLDLSDPSKITIGFSQSESTSNPFRATETSSIVAEAKKDGFKLIQRNANASVSQQNTDVSDLIAQGAQFLIIAPEDSAGIGPALSAAKAKHIPVLTIDRTAVGTECQDFVAFIGSNFLGQAKIAADDLGGALNGAGSVAILEGTSGNNVATERTTGFKTEMAAKYPNIKIAFDQTANFDEATGQKVTAQALQANPNLTGIYAENDEMALGALQAIKAAGKTAGKDIKVVTIDGIQECVQDVVDGTIVADVETNPRFGPLAFQSITNFYNGTGVPASVIIQDHHFTSANAAAAIKDGDVY
jgi:ABC-type sugar transport system substrate-binding protein